MAVNYANGLSELIGFSGLIATRKEGVLKDQLEKEVHYNFLNKKNNNDVRAFLKLRAFCVANKVQYIHAHSSSFFWAVLVKLSLPRIKVIWHDHYGNRANETKNNFILKLLSSFFYLVISVNYELKNWSEKNLRVKKVTYLPNFSIYKDENQKSIKLNGIEGKRIVFLANLKQPKNHIAFLKAFNQSEIYEEGWTLHLIGKDFNDDYSNELKEFILNNNLNDSIYIYGSQENIPNILKQAKVGVLCSTYEGFPVTLIEYGIFGLLVLSTNVGFCKNLVENEEGFLFNPNDVLEISEALKLLKKENSHLELDSFSKKFNEKIIENYSWDKILNEYLKEII